jgi:hypothetical protein
MTQTHTFQITLTVRANERQVSRDEIAADLERMLTAIQETGVPAAAVRPSRSPAGTGDSVWWTNDVRAARITAATTRCGCGRRIPDDEARAGYTSCEHCTKASFTADV